MQLKPFTQFHSSLTFHFLSDLFCLMSHIYFSNKKKLSFWVYLIFFSIKKFQEHGAKSKQNVQCNINTLFRSQNQFSS